jgi:nanoRNase/pAp phosphatase (c-di-AMP/oligoRNAs hydrolase)
MRIDTDFAANPAAITQLWTLDFDAVMALGAVELDRVAVLIARYVEQRYFVMLPGQADYTLAVDIDAGDYGITSQLGHNLADMSASSMAAVVTRKEDDPDNVRVSLRSVSGVDTTVVSKQFGGGGHKGASGCTIPLGQWNGFKQ